MDRAKNLNVFLVVIIISAAFGVFMSGCEEEGPDPIIGDWESSEELNCDGIGSYSERCLGEQGTDRFDVWK
jgi:hypothetical protein